MRIRAAQERHTYLAPGNAALAPAQGAKGSARQGSPQASHTGLGSAMTDWDYFNSDDEESQLQNPVGPPPVLPCPVTPPHRLYIDERDYHTCGWWSKPLMAATQRERAVRGAQARALRFCTGCSGTEAPAFGLKAQQQASLCHDVSAPGRV